ncbi:MAG TPA: endonuclease MutS2 [Candidatus Merdivicinus intestinavium]|nr:endonuclease MutS2 [Candidatus Merdivicinus intestinavium]
MIHKKYTKVLELDKVLEMLAEETCCETSRQMALSIEPETDIDEVTRSLKRTDDAFNLSVRFGSPAFSGMHDPGGKLKVAMAGGVLSIRDLLNIGAVLRQSRSLLQWARQFEDEENSITEGLFSLYTNQSLERDISAAFVNEEEVADTASGELLAIRRKIRQTELKVRERMDKLIHSNTYQKYLQDSIVTMRDGRFVVPVKAEYRGAVDGLVHDTSASGSTYFIEPMGVVEANNEIRVLQAKEKEEIERILAEFSARCADCGEDITLLFGKLMDLNVLFAKSRLASKMNAIMPAVTENGCLELKKARHPLIDPKKVVPVDVRLGGEFTCLVITGPNTGGKTVTLKTIGLLTLMAMCGLLIPVSSGSTISTFENILVAIGDEQSIEQSLSTFSAHMTNLVSILKEADYRSLVLMDELCSGTDPVEGAALAIAILEKFRKRSCRVAATTHYAELKMYALQTEKVENACCEFDVESLKPTYRLLIGVPGRSNAFAISQKLGLADDIIDHAKELVQSENKRFEDVIESLEASRQEFEARTREVEEAQAEINRARKEIKDYQQKLAAERAAEVEKAKQQAMQIVSQVQGQANALMDELNDIRKEQDKAEFSKRALAARSQLRSRLGKMYDTANPVSGGPSNDGYVLPRPLKKGDAVLIVDIDKEGTVIQDPDKSGNVLVQAGIIKTKAKLENLRLIEKKKVQFNGSNVGKQRGSVSRSVNVSGRRAPTECDLRGMTTDEAIFVLDAFLDNCVLTHVNQATIIHGRGTGALRAAVQKRLKELKCVKSFRLGVYGEGEDGVTIVELK